MEQRGAAVENLVTRSSFWLDRPTFVTGATGLVGSWLLKRLLAAGADVTCLVRDWVPKSEAVRTGALAEVKVIRGDVCDQPLVERALVESEADTVFHLAAQTIVPIANRNPLSTFNTNIAGTWNVLESCRRLSTVKQIIVASSDKAYGQQASLPYTEESPLVGSHPYDASKSCADLLSLAYAKSFGLPAAVTRCGNFYGGGDLNFNRIIPGTIRSALRGQRPVIRSDGTLVRDYFYVEDGAAAYMLLAEQLAEKPWLAGQAFNFSNETPMSVVQIAQKLLSLMSSDLDLDVRGEAANEIHSQYLNAAKAHAELGWKAAFDIDTGLRRTVDWYTKFFSNE